MGYLRKGGQQTIVLTICMYIICVYENVGFVVLIKTIKTYRARNKLKISPVEVAHSWAQNNTSCNALCTVKL